jgi:hypothetical protein
MVVEIIVEGNPMRVRGWHFLALSLVLLLVGCATLGGAGKTFVDSTPKEKSLFFMHTYIQEYEDVERQVNEAGGWDNLSEGQKVILGKKIEVLLRAHPLINAFNTYVELDMAPDIELEANIMELINQLIELGTGEEI